MEAGVVAQETPKLQNYMRTNFPWQVRTGRAHQSLTASYTKDDTGFTIALSHGVSYGVYLELAHEKKYAITHPTAKAKAPEVMKNFQNLFNKLQ